MVANIGTVVKYMSFSNLKKWGKNYYGNLQQYCFITFDPGACTLKLFTVVIYRFL